MMVITQLPLTGHRTIRNASNGKSADRLSQCKDRNLNRNYCSKSDMCTNGYKSVR